MDQTCFGSRGFFGPMSNPLFQGRRSRLIGRTDIGGAPPSRPPRRSIASALFIPVNGRLWREADIQPKWRGQLSTISVQRRGGLLDRREDIAGKRCAGDVLRASDAEVRPARVDGLEHRFSRSGASDLKQKFTSSHV
jgi:hypothetical protein